MNKDLAKVESIRCSELVRSSAEFGHQHQNEWMHTHQTKWVTKFGTNSDGHGRITAAQIYSGALREAYNIAQSIEGCAINAKRAYAKQLESEAALKKKRLFFFPLAEHTRIKLECDLTEAKNAQEAQRIQAEGLRYMLEAHEEVIQELGPQVRAKYASFEASEHDNWIETAKYWIAKGGEQLTHLPLPMTLKADVGIALGRKEMTLALEGFQERGLDFTKRDGALELFNRIVEDKRLKQLEEEKNNGQNKVS